MCFVWIWEQTAIISLYSIDWLVFITEAESVYCAVRYGSLYTIQTHLKPSGHYIYHQFNIHQFYVLPTQCICVFCVDRINRLVFITEMVVCLLRGTDWVFIYNSNSSKAQGSIYVPPFNIHKFYVLLTQIVYVFCVDLRTNSDYFPIQH